MNQFPNLSELSLDITNPAAVAAAGCFESVYKASLEYAKFKRALDQEVYDIVVAGDSYIYAMSPGTYDLSHEYNYEVTGNQLTLTIDFVREWYDNIELKSCETHYHCVVALPFAEYANWKLLGVAEVARVAADECAAHQSRVSLIAQQQKEQRRKQFEQLKQEFG